MNKKVKNWIGYGIIGIGLLGFGLVAVDHWVDYKAQKAYEAEVRAETREYLANHASEPDCANAGSVSVNVRKAAGMHECTEYMSSNVPSEQPAPQPDIQQEEEFEYEGDMDPTPEELERLGLPVTEPEITPVNYDWPYEIREAHDADMRRLIENYTIWLGRNQGVRAAQDWCESKLFGVLMAGRIDDYFCPEAALKGSTSP